MNGDIRKISIGPDYKTGAMHYIVGQKVLGGSHDVYCIKKNTIKNSLEIFISNEKKEVTLWKEFSHTVPISIEFNIDF
jgi:hypothetical protein